MTTAKRKVSVSLDEDLVTALEAEGESLSAQVNAAIREELEQRRRRRLLGELLDRLEREHGSPDEALIAAIYLDGGLEPAQRFIVAELGPLVASAGDQAADATFTEDWKSALQEWLQAQGRGLPHYRLAAATGPDHRKRFDVEVLVGGVVAGRALGRSKKEAEQQAARQALAALQGGESDK